MKKYNKSFLIDVNCETLKVRQAFPFTALIGQTNMKLALILNVIDPKIGGVMSMGDRGTGKSTIVRSLVDLLPNIQVVSEDPFNSDPIDYDLMSQEVKEAKKSGEKIYTTSIKTPMVDLPLGATEDRVCGTIDIEKALIDGTKAFEPGLLAKANRGILYVDEVNLLDDHLVDILLDSAAGGWNTVEREGISIVHPARFILIGSGNPEEGELRPQLLDRFGMHVRIKTIKDPLSRVKIVERRSNFDKSAESFLKNYEYLQDFLKNRIVNAQGSLKDIKIDYQYKVNIAELCSNLNIDGLRGDIVTNRAVKAFVALNSRKTVLDKDVFTIMSLCLTHRLKKNPLESIDSSQNIVTIFKDIFGYSDLTA
ncbi:Mg-protoporphyrin IX (plastid) [Bigelowiella natans]|uniref:Magnesium-chelatase subunit ChlI n=1 Tax=Bigelowiella natans TaxID=227086 RepID=CHLI_BIGNA|nr:Mg-protoporphyrin IX [Bigelowiella natans]Q06J65.1 RecName: Full=Magnesium-chelatase subunit ChlI; AltName: Full=Mg-protoporphyrin IX chelatase [Bigelowiella natans]ABG91394.1 Mg-protoporphyrin IX [Bigelowiella natans]